MTWLVVVLAFLVLGVAVIAAAFGGGRRSASSRPSPASRRLVAAGAVGLIVVTGIGLPVLGLVSGHDDAADAAPGVKLTAGEVKGRQLFAEQCSNCHTLAAANAVGKVGPNLDVLRPKAALIEDAVRNGRARGAGQMPQGLLSGQDLKNVAAFVETSAGR
jgi:mono/diheme cytochrome c family protein